MASLDSAIDDIVRDFNSTGGTTTDYFSIKGRLADPLKNITVAEAQSSHSRIIAANGEISPWVKGAITKCLGDALGAENFPN